jgi:predicted naringenin-chalcone synthase
MYLANFQSLRPGFISSQDELLQALGHFLGAGLSGEGLRELDRKIQRYACSADKIKTRGHEINLEETLGGAEARTRFYRKCVEPALRKLYESEDLAPSDLLHVTCTGYHSPSAAQVLVDEKGWGKKTRVSHAYHMGCYASIPALRYACGFLAAPLLASKRVDIVHSELCSLHLNVNDASPEQLVIQSLFADGYIRYSALDEPKDLREEDSCFEVIALHEEILSATKEQMTWFSGDEGMKMSLKKEVPLHLFRSIRPFVETLLSKLPQEGRVAGENGSQRVFAIHPGGPRIIEGVEKILELERVQVKQSYQILETHGNMSSATLPHIWKEILEDDSVQVGTEVLSLAFGPGLTACGAVFKKYKRNSEEEIEGKGRSL